MRAYQTRLQKIDEHFATALGALESSFVFASSPRHIIDKAIENVPPKPSRLKSRTLNSPAFSSPSAHTSQ